MKWAEFKELVQEMRKRNNALMKQNGGSNRVTISITVYDEEANDCVDVCPHAINLITGKDFVKVRGDYEYVNIKKLLDVAE